MSYTDVRERLVRKLSDYETFIRSGAFNESRNAQFRGEAERLQAQLQAIQDFDRDYRGIVAPTRIDRNSPLTSRKDRRNYDRLTKAAFEMALRGKTIPTELRTYAPLDSTDDTQGAFLVPTITADEVDHLVKSPGNLLSAVRIVPTTGGSTINWPTSDGTANNGEFINENGAIGQANATYGHVPLGSFQWSSKEVIAPLSVVQDTQYPLLQNLTEEFAQRAERGWSARIVTDATDGIINISGTGNLSAASSSVVDYFEALNLQSKIESGYAVRGSYVLSYATMLAYAALKTTTGSAVWPEAERAAGRMHGRPYVITNDMPSVAHSAKYLGFGDMSKILFRKVGAMTVHVLREIFMSDLQVGFIAQQRVSSKVIQPSALAFLVGA